MPYFSFSHTVLVFAVCSHSAALAEALGGNQWERAGLGEKSLGPPSSSPILIHTWVTPPITGVTMAAQSWHEGWHEGQYDDFGDGAMKSVQCPVKAKNSFYCTAPG